jgi:hypothetical protein
MTNVFANTSRHRTEFAAELTVHGLPGMCAITGR